MNRSEAALSCGRGCHRFRGIPLACRPESANCTAVGKQLMWKTTFCVLLAALCLGWPARGEQPAAQDNSRSARLRDAKFGMFIHWGLYAIPAKGEWVMASEKRTVADYGKLAQKFNPVQFDAEQWVRIAKAAGMRYIVITAKHHDGFAMFGSKASAYNIVDSTPFGRDPLEELARACEEGGIGLGFYYSQFQDWHHPGGGGGKWDPAQHGKLESYFAKVAFPQLRELLTGYGPVFSLWFDTPGPPEITRAADFAGLVRSVQPQTLVNSRVLYSGRAINGLDDQQLDGLAQMGVDYLTYADRQIPARPQWPDWETCMTLNESWGYNAKDKHWKSPRELIEQLVKVASRGGNFLLNVGPSAAGLIPEPSVERLREVGRWLEVNGRAIYGTTAGPLGTVNWGRSTARIDKDGSGSLFLHVFDWPKDGNLSVPGLRSKIAKASLLADGAVLETTAGAEGVVVALPAVAPDPIASVIELKFKAPLEVTRILPGPDTAGVVRLEAATAETGGSVRVEEQGGRSCLGNWSFWLDSVAWTFKGHEPGSYRVQAELAGTGPVGFLVTCGEAEVEASCAVAGGPENFQSVELGTVDIGGGEQTLTLTPVKDKWKPIRLGSLILSPVQKPSAKKK